MNAIKVILLVHKMGQILPFFAMDVSPNIFQSQQYKEHRFRFRSRSLTSQGHFRLALKQF